MATTKKSSGVQSAPVAAPSGAFFEIPLELIIVEGLIRSWIDEAGEAFLGLLESIRMNGVLEPIIVTPRDGKYVLISGARRLLACRQLGLPTIPARVIESVAERDKILGLQLTENLQRSALDPIDEAGAMVAYIQARHEDEGLDLDAVMNVLVTMDRDPSRVDPEIAVTVTAIRNISGKSSSSLRRSFSLLRLPEEIQNALREGLIGVSLGYIFAANVDHPDLMMIFQKAVGEEFTQDGLEKAFRKGQKAAAVRKRSIVQLRGSVRSLKSALDEQTDPFRKSDIEAFLADVQELATALEARLPEAIDDGGPAKPLPAPPQPKKKKKVIA